MCNNIAFISQSKDLDFQKIVAQFKLGLVYGREGGKKGTGVLYNGKVRRSRDGKYREGTRVWISDNHDSYDFVPTLVFTKDEKSDHHVIMGHNRAPSSGMGRGEDFIHPFEYGEVGNRMWFQHNGTISNINALCTHFGIDYKDFGNDSKALGHLIYNGVDQKELFKFYEGAATCLWYYEATKEIKVFVGATKGYSGKFEVDRDLFYCKTDDGFWLNTKDEILNTILDYEYDPRPVTPNTILTAKADGTIVHSPVARDKSKYKATTSNYSGWSVYDDDWDDLPIKNTTVKPKKDTKIVQINVDQIDNRDYVNGKACWYNGRYYFQGILMHGRYYINESGILDYQGEEYSFYLGKMLKEHKYFEKARKEGFANCNWYHPKTLTPYNSRGKIYWRHNNQKIKKKRLVTDILFCDYKVAIKSNRIFHAKARIINPVFKPHITSYKGVTPVEKCENYSRLMGGDFSAFPFCVAHYKKFMQMPAGSTIISSKYQHDFDSLMAGHDEVILDEYTEAYNNYYNDNCITRFQVMEDYFNANNLSGGEVDQIGFYKFVDSIINGELEVETNESTHSA